MTSRKVDHPVTHNSLFTVAVMCSYKTNCRLYLEQGFEIGIDFYIKILTKLVISS